VARQLPSLTGGGLSALSEGPITVLGMSEFASESNQAAQEEVELIGASPDAGDPALQKDPSDWVSGEDPMTPAQRSYLETLARQAGEELPADLSKAEASQHIDRLKSQLGTGE
jgi:Protein of unknown function (DUF3072)